MCHPASNLRATSRPQWMTAAWACWGIGATLGTLLEAIVRLTPIVAQALAMPELHPLHVLVLLVWVGCNTYFEGYRGFHRSFSPRCVATAISVAQTGTLATRLLSPLVCLGLIYVPRRRLIASWALVVGIVSLVMLVRLTPQPWRGIIDAGVVSALAFGLLSIVGHSVRAVWRRSSTGAELLSPAPTRAA